MERLWTAVHSLKRLATDGGDPLGDCAREFFSLDDPCDGLLVMPNRRFADTVAETMALNGVEVSIGTHADLTGHDIYASAVVVGPPTWIPRAYSTLERQATSRSCTTPFFRENPVVTPLLLGPAVSTLTLRAPSIRRSPSDAGALEPPAPDVQPREQDAVDPLAAEECSPSEAIRGIHFPDIHTREATALLPTMSRRMPRSSLTAPMCFCRRRQTPGSCRCGPKSFRTSK